MRGEICIGDAVNWGAALNRGLVSWWLALPGQQRGNVFRDLCLRNHGTLVNGPEWSGFTRPGGYGSLFFDGTNDYVGTDNVTPFNFERTDKFSAFLWIRTTAAANKAILSNRQTSAASNGWEIVQPTADPAKIQVNIGGTAIAVRGTATINDGNWHFVGFTYDGSSTAAGTNVYVDSVAGKTTIADALGGSISTTAALRIGGRNDGTVPYSGRQDSIMVFSRELTPGEVVAIYKASRLGYPDELNWQSRPVLALEQAASGNRLRRYIICGAAA
jgi:hypothetical protein